MSDNTQAEIRLPVPAFVRERVSLSHKSFRMPKFPASLELTEKGFLSVVERVADVPAIRGSAIQAALCEIAII